MKPVRFFAPRIPVETAIALVARANGVDPAAALGMSPNDFVKAAEAAKKGRMNWPG